MSGDVQPRKRKDKKKKKDELSIEEPRGVAALGEGDVFMHSQHDHGTGGHWCAKIIFFSLLAVLITLIGLIILENRGLSELEANAVESRYAGILEGWIEDAPDDDHHDEHTLELKHHDDDEDDHYGAHDDHDEDEHGDEDEAEGHDDDDEDHDGDEEGHEDEEDEENQDEQLDSEEQDLEATDNEEEDDRTPYKYFADDDDDEDDEENDEDKGNDDEDEDERHENYDDEEPKNDGDDDEDNDGGDDQEYNQDDENLSNEDNKYEQDELLDDDDEYRNQQSLENEDDDNDEEHFTNGDHEHRENKEDEEEHEEDDEHEEDEEIEVERIEKEASEEEPISTELPALPEEEDDDDDDHKHEEADDSHEDDDGADDDDQQDEVDQPDDDDQHDDDDADDDFLETDDEPVVERITAPAGKPFVEVDEDEVSSEQPPQTLEEEEEYEKQQEELRREEEQSSHMWLKLVIGGALLAATHAVMRRATAPRDEPEEERMSREETPVDRRMTLIPEEEAPLPVVSKKVPESKRAIVEEVVKKTASVAQAAPVEDSEEEIEEPEVIEEETEEIEEPQTQEVDKEIYSDDEDEEEEAPQKKVETKPAQKPQPVADPEDEDPDDVEIIDDDEELEEEEEDVDDISDVDDAELLSRLEAKYGRLPEPERPTPKHKDGGNSLDDDWPGEPNDPFWRQQLDSAEDNLRQGEWSAVLERMSVQELRPSGRARFLVASALDRMAEAKRDNALLSRAILAYLDVLKMNEQLPDKKLLQVAQRALDRIQFRGNYLSAEPVYRLLIRRFPDEPAYRNNLTISFLMANRVDLAEEVLKETLGRWPNDRVALAHYGFVLKTQQNKLEEAVEMFEKALKGDKGPACEPRFYYHYGDALLLLGRFKEAHEVHKRGAKYGHFLSASQRSLYNVPRLKGRPWWNVNDTPYSKLARALEKSWRDILKEGEAAEVLFEKEKEGLKERGQWSQMDLFVQGREIPGRCKSAPITCGIIKSEPAAAGCRRGQIKFSAMGAGTHVRPHVGPTNCRLRMHLGLSNTKDTYIRVDQETRQWQEGKVLLFDDSFEHEVWHNGTGKRLVLIVDVWHPELTAVERRSLPAI